MTGRRWVLASVPALLAASALAGCGGSSRAAPVKVPPLAGPGASIAVTADGLTVPESVPAGPVRFGFTNGGTVTYTLFVAKITDPAKGGAHLQLALDDGAEVPPAWAQMAGALADVPAGVTLDDYVVVVDSDDRWVVAAQAKGRGHDFVAELNVTDPEAGFPGADELPAAHVTITADEFGYDIEPAPRAGNQRLRITNGGEQDHSFTLVRLDGISLEDALRDRGAKGATFVGDLGYLDPGYSAVTHARFTPGRYGLVCFLPDASPDGEASPHYRLGMKETFEIK